MDYDASQLEASPASQNLIFSAENQNRSVLKELNKNQNEGGGGGGSAATLSPLALKSPKQLSLSALTDQSSSKPLGMLRGSLPSTPTGNTPTKKHTFDLASSLNQFKGDAEMELLKLNRSADGSDGDAGAAKFTGLPEFDETQIPELAPLSVEDELKVHIGQGDGPSMPLSSTVKFQEQDYNSDSDVFVECLSLNSAKFSNETSETEAFRTALPGDSIQASNSTKLENTLSNEAAPHNMSYEPMDVDEINATMEMLKDVLDPQDRQLLQEQFMSEIIRPRTPTPEVPKEEEKEPEKQVEIQTVQEEVLPERPVTPINLAASLKEEENVQVTPTLSPVAMPAFPLSPPIPTHRPKTAEELAELMALRELPLPSEEEEGTSPVKVTPLSLDTTCSMSSSLRNSAANSPTFPLQNSPLASPKHFPCSPKTPKEQEGEPYLEKSTIQPSLDRQLSLTPGVVTKAPVTIEITQASPEQLNNYHLNETMPVSNASESPLNGTFNPEYPEEIVGGAIIHPDLNGSSDRRTFSVAPAEDSDQPRRSFSVRPTSATDEEVFSFPSLSADDQSRRTFCLPSNVDEVKEKSQPRHTFNVPSPAVEQLEEVSPAFAATEEDEAEPMDVDVSLQVESAFATPMSSPMPTPSQKKIRQPLTAFSPPIPTHQPQRMAALAADLAEAQAVDLPPPSPPSEKEKSPPLPTHRRAIHSPENGSPHLAQNATVVVPDEQALSAKEQATLSASDEKDDVFVEHFGAISPVSDDLFKAPQYTSDSFANLAVKAARRSAGSEEQFFDSSDFNPSGSNNNLILNSSDFDYLYTKGTNNAPVDRSSLLLKFDPLLGAPVPVNQQSTSIQQQQLLNVLSNHNNNLNRALSPTIEEHELSGSNQSFVIGSGGGGEQQPKTSLPELSSAKSGYKPPVDRTKKHAKMSVDVIDNDCNKTFDNSNLSNEDKANNYNNMGELEKKIKNEVTKSEDIERKLKEAEQREEALIKRITEKDKTVTKLNGVIEAYEKAIAELINEKEQLVQNHERQLQEVQADRDSNYHHLTSLETTFSDFHAKYEKSKEMTIQLKNNEETLIAEKKQTMENLRMQEQRYDKMKSHAMQQLEIANKKLDTIAKEHADEVKKLKALLKKEEVSRVSIAEQLQQKSRENADLVKICEELIYGKGQGGSS